VAIKMSLGISRCSLVSGQKTIINLAQLVLLILRSKSSGLNEMLAGTGNKVRVRNFKKSGKR
jgi:hypothetical protein